MRTLTIRSSIGAVRLLAVSAAVAAGIAGFGSTGAGVAATDVPAAAAGSGLARACDHAGDKAAAGSRIATFCRGFGSDFGLITF